MRFHFGMSFSWRTIKKYLIPILLGVLAYFGFNFIYDNSSIPLGYIFKPLEVYAQDDFNHSYILNYDTTDYYNISVDSTYTFKTFIEYLDSLNSNYYKFYVVPYLVNNGSTISLNGFNIFIFNKSITSLDILLAGQVNSSDLKSKAFNNLRYFYFDSSTFNDITSSDIYTKFYSCYMNNSNCISNSSGTLSSGSYYRFGSLSSNVTNDSDFNVSLPYIYSSGTFNYSTIYYSQVPFLLNTDYGTSQSYFFKNIVLNGNTLSSGDRVPTIKEYIDSLPEPGPEPTPDPEPDTVHKGIHDKVYWFDDPNTTLGVLSSLYILLFLYCFTMIILKIIELIKKKRW